MESILPNKDSSDEYVGWYFAVVNVLVLVHQFLVRAVSDKNIVNEARIRVMTRQMQDARYELSQSRFV